jgi:hypothetical protein
MDVHEFSKSPPPSKQNDLAKQANVIARRKSVAEPGVDARTAFPIG